MSFRKCPEPKRRQLAIHAPWGQFHGYGVALRGEHAYWAIEQARAESEVDLTAHHVAISMHRKLGQIANSQQLDVLSPLLQLRRESHIVERDRRRGLGLIATSKLLRQFIEPGVTPLDDARDVGYATLMVDMMTGKDGMPLDHRLHVAPAIAAEVLPEPVNNDQWYMEGDLYVRRVQPADISQPMVNFVEQQGVPINPDELVTLFPYLKAIVGR